MTKPLPKNVIYAIIVSATWMLVEIALWTWMEIRKSDYYSWGPSSTFSLPFTDIIVDTWAKWTALMIHTTVSVSIGVFSADMFYPWMGSVALNPEVPILHNRLHTWIAVNFFWFISSVNGLMFFMLIYSQFDVALNSACTAVIMGMYSSHRAIHDKTRANFSANTPQDINEDEELGLITTPIT